MILEPAPLSVLDEPYEKGLAQFNREYEAVLLEEHAKKLAAASRGRKMVRWLRRAFCSCMGPLIEEVPPVYTPATKLPGPYRVNVDGTLMGTLEQRRELMQGKVKPSDAFFSDAGTWLKKMKEVRMEDDNIHRNAEARQADFNSV